jgi:hypothetical protein
MGMGGMSLFLTSENRLPSGGFAAICKEEPGAALGGISNKPLLVGVYKPLSLLPLSLVIEFDCERGFM